MSYATRYDRAYVLVQRGNEEISPSKPFCAGLKDGMIGFLDPQMWSEQVVFSDYYMGETCILEVDRDWLDTLPDAVKGDGDIESDPSSYRRTASYLDPADILPYVESQCPDFINLFYQHKYRLPVFQVDRFPKGKLKSSKNKEWPDIPDVGQITQGNYTVGAGAFDYPTFGGVGGAWAAMGSPLTGDLTFTLSSSITETATAAANIQLATHTLLNTSSAPHYGDPTAGWLITINHNSNLFSNNCDDVIGGGYVVFEHFHSVNAVGAAINSAHLLNSGIAGSINTIVRDWIADGASKLGYRGMVPNDPQSTFDLSNIVVVGCKDHGIRFGTSGVSRVENITAVGNTYGFGLNNLVVTLSNCIAYDSGMSDFSAHANATGQHCTSSDATAAGFAVNLNSVVGAVSANDLQSTNVALATFADIVEGGALDSTGIANTIVARTACIRNRPVPNAGGFTSRGAAEIPTPEPLPPPADESELHESYIGVAVAAHGLGL